MSNVMKDNFLMAKSGIFCLPRTGVKNEMLSLSKGAMRWIYKIKKNMTFLFSHKRYIFFTVQIVTYLFSVKIIISNR